MDWLPEAVALASSAWGAWQTYKRKKEARERAEREKARRELLRQQLHGIEVRGEAISSILDRVKDFDELWRPIKKGPAK